MSSSWELFSFHSVLHVAVCTNMIRCRVNSQDMPTCLCSSLHASVRLKKGTMDTSVVKEPHSHKQHYSH